MNGFYAKLLSTTKWKEEHVDRKWKLHNLCKSPWLNCCSVHRCGVWYGIRRFLSSTDLNKRSIPKWPLPSRQQSHIFFLVINYPHCKMGLNSVCLWHPTKSSREIMLSLESVFSGSLVEWVNAVAVFLQLFPHFSFSHLEAVTSGCSVLDHMQAQQETLGFSDSICCPNNCSSLPQRKTQWADRNILQARWG